MADEEEELPVSEVPRIILEASEQQGGAPTIYVDGVHSRLRSHSMVKISLYQDLPPLVPRIEGEKVKAYPRRKIVVNLIIDGVAFADIASTLSEIVRDMIKDGSLVVERDDEQQAAP